MSGEPIWVDCVGGGASPIRTTYDPATMSFNGGCYIGMCAMCGGWFEMVEDRDVIVHHDRDDVLARIDRGDFE